MTIRENWDAGRPVVAVEPDGAHAAIYKSIANAVMLSLEEGAFVRAFPKIVIE